MTYERQESAIDITGNEEREAERADHVGLFGDEDDAREARCDLPAEIQRLPVGWAILLGGIVAERTGLHSWRFWRPGFQEAQ